MAANHEEDHAKQEARAQAVRSAHACRYPLSLIDWDIVSKGQSHFFFQSAHLTASVLCGTVKTWTFRRHELGEEKKKDAENMRLWLRILISLQKIYFKKIKKWEPKNIG